ncbi:transcriptional regulator [Streptomyces sp. NE5-10]|nr:transcriptional regulator [Streptomyces sp. NE5-10]
MGRFMTTTFGRAARPHQTPAVGTPGGCTLVGPPPTSLPGVESLGAFLKNRRDRVTPERIGLRTYGTARRVPGLRREELAQLAGVSAGYYTRLEQGLADGVSEQVLGALARVLELDPVETAHLHNLARRPPRTVPVEPPAEEPHPRVLALLDALAEATPAIVLGRRGDVLAWNRAGHALFAEHLDFAAPESTGTRPSIPRMFFLDPLTRELHRNWDELARVHVAYLRLTAGRFPGDARLAGLIGELAMHDDRFAALWASGEVADCTTGDMRLRHPVVGSVDVAYQVWLQPDSPDHRLEVYTPLDGPSGDALAALARRKPVR